MVMWGVGEDEMKGRHGLLTTHRQTLAELAFNFNLSFVYVTIQNKKI